MDIIGVKEVEIIKTHSEKFREYLVEIITTLYWSAVAVPLGLVTGIIGGLFCCATDWVTGYRIEKGWPILLLPAGAVLINFLYDMADYGNDNGTGTVIKGIHSKTYIPLKIAPLIFVSATFSHFCGASVGRVGSTFQMGGSIGAFFAKKLKLTGDARDTLIICCISGVFSGLFGTPLTGAFFALEAISIGRFYSGALLPSIICSLISKQVALALGASALSLSILATPDVNTKNIIFVIILAIISALVSNLYCNSIDLAKKFFGDIIKSVYLRSLILGTAVFVLTMVLGTDYNGGGGAVVQSAMNGQALGYVFLLKILFTTLCLAAGYRGGEVFPALFIGATLGCTYGNLIGFYPSFAAGIALICLFCAITNCPITSFILAFELFGSAGIGFFLLAIGISYMVSGYTGIFSSQDVLEDKYSRSIDFKLKR